LDALIPDDPPQGPAPGSVGWFDARRTAAGLAAGAVAIALLTLLIAVLKPHIDPEGLTGLYLFAILPVAIVWGFWVAGIVAVASFLAFVYFIVPPLHTFDLGQGDAVAGLTISIAAAYTVSELARRANERAREARLRASEAEGAQSELGLLAEEQAALRRVATLVAQAVPTSEVFEAVTREVGLRSDADLARMERFEADRTVTALAAWSRSGDAGLAVGKRIALAGISIAAQVLETGRPARVDSFAGASGPIADEAAALGIRSSVGCPIVVGGRTWGVIAASSRQEAPFPPDTESRIADFTELVATAVGNAAARAEVVASRARVVTAGDEARRRLERDLHDGAQQRLVHTIVMLKLARRAQDHDAEAARKLVGDALEAAEEANEELRELAHGLLPPILSRGGVSAGVEALVSRVRVPVSVDVTEERFPAEIEASAYFLVAEALTNMAKHSEADRAVVKVWVADGELLVDVRDDGVGGARPEGSGLVGLSDRVTAFGGRLRVDSPPGGGTRITAALPLPRR
jgi:signal transduction histidine kinase